MFKIGFKLSIAVAISTIMIIGIYGVIAIEEQNHILVGVVERQANQLSETVKNSMRYGMLIRQRDHVDHIIESIVKEPHIHDIRVFNKDGMIIYASLRSDVGRIVDKHGEQCYACHTADQPLISLSVQERMRLFQIEPDSSRILGIINPVYNEPACWRSECHAHHKDQAILGVVDVTISMADVDREILSSERQIIILTVSAILAMVTVIVLFVKRWVHDPVRELIFVTEQVAQGHFTNHIKRIRKDELGVLQRAFNSMTKRLSEARLYLFQSDNMKSISRLATGVANEINNPLTIIMDVSSSLKNQITNGSIRNDLQNIFKESERARNIVRNLLDFARQSTPSRRKIEIHKIIEMGIEGIGRNWDSNQIIMKTNISEDISEIWVDPDQFQQALRNLVENAIDAIGDTSGVVQIMVKKRHLHPFGVAPIRFASCLRGHDLFQVNKFIKGQAVICMEAVCKNQRGHIFIDPVYGGEGTYYSFDYLGNEPVRLYCPICGVEQTIQYRPCPDCGAKVYRFKAQISSVVEGCTRPSCSWQRWPVIDDQGKQEYLEIAVQDTGCGIAAEDLSRIFDPFYTTKGNKGTGLGLSVTWGIVSLHDGTLHVQSEPGMGTTFTMRFLMRTLKDPENLKARETIG